MRRKEKELTNLEEKLNIIDQCKVCRLAMCSDGIPYIVPLNFGYTYKNDQLTLYFHSAAEGKKIDILAQNTAVCFEMDCRLELIESNIPCSYSYAYQSIIGTGTVCFLQDPADKTDALNHLMQHQTGRPDCYSYPDKMLQSISVYAVSVSEFTAKQQNPPSHASQ